MAAGTIGTLATPTSKPIPFSSSHRTVPVAASRPNALPPDSTMAWICWTVGRRVEKIGLPRAGRAATNVDAGHGSRLGQYHRAAGGSLRERVVSRP